MSTPNKITARRITVRWSEEEVAFLIKGFNKYPYSWAKILQKGHRVFETGRTHVDLKDKWRNLVKQKDERVTELMEQPSPRKKWAEGEDKALCDLYEMYPRNWRKISEDEAFKGRTPMNLRDKWRNLIKYGHKRAKALQLTNESPTRPKSPAREPLENSAKSSSKKKKRRKAKESSDSDSELNLSSDGSEEEQQQQPKKKKETAKRKLDMSKTSPPKKKKVVEEDGSEEEEEEQPKKKETAKRKSKTPPPKKKKVVESDQEEEEGASDSGGEENEFILQPPLPKEKMVRGPNGDYSWWQDWHEVQTGKKVAA